MPSLEELPFTLYMGTVVFLTILLLPPLRPVTLYRVIIIILTALSLLLTWSQMLLYLRQSYEDSASRARVPLERWSTQQWLGSTQLFEEAWGYVCAEPERWWWSSQICLATVGVWTPFLWSQGRRHRIAFLVLYLVLGEMVAISFAAGLFLLSTGLATSPDAPTKADQLSRPVPDGVAPTSLLFALVVGQAMTHAVPSVVGTWRFLPVLGIMHIVILIPLLPLGTPPAGPASLLRPRISHLYALSALLSAMHHLTLTFFRLPRVPESSPSLPSYLISVLAHHPAQASVSLDVICFAAIQLVWMMADWRSLLSLHARLTRLRRAKEPRRKDEDGPAFGTVAIAVWGLAPLLGPAAVSAGYMAWREQTLQGLEQSLKKVKTETSS